MSEGKVEFALFCYQLGSQAMACLGVGAGEGKDGEEKPAVDLGQAKHLIDLLEMLREKSEGNRTEEETKVLMGLLYDLRMRYVEASRPE